LFEHTESGFKLCKLRYGVELLL